MPPLFMATPNISDLATLGLRVERLLYFGSILVLLCFVTLYFALASGSSETDTDADLGKFIARVEEARDRLQGLYANSPARTRPAPITTEKDREAAATRRALGLPPKSEEASQVTETYAQALQRLVDGARKELRFTAEVSRLVEDPQKSPDAIITALKRRREELAAKPVTVWGIASPRLLPMSYGGATYQLPADFVATALLAALVPLVLGWLTALYLTRQRELLAIRELRAFSQSFPHVLNMLPVVWANSTPFHTRSRRRRHNLRLEVIGIKIWFSIVRTVVILVFAVPMAYLLSYSGYALANPNTSDTLVFGGLGLVVWAAFQILILLMQEWLLLWDREFYA